MKPKQNSIIAVGLWTMGALRADILHLRATRSVFLAI